MFYSEYRKFLSSFLGVFLLGLLGCAPYFKQPMRTSEARLGAETYAGEKVDPLPLPQRKVVAAVYKFRDQTGQYKPVINGNSFSTAVTQGATSILLRALEETGWFTTIERENIGNLLNERKIIRSSRAEFGDKTALSPLLFGGVILEGGIISYDANVITGGAGLRYFGAGASGQYRQDRITVYLRAVSTSNGRILKTVYTSKTILSQKVDASLFRFVRFKRLLEAETGFTYNEPSEMAVKDAIEKAVESLIIEGIIDGLWQAKDPEEAEKLVTAYKEEKEENADIDFLGRKLEVRRKKWSIGVQAGGQLYAGDYKDAMVKAGYGVSLGFSPNPRIGLSFHGGKSFLATRDYYDGEFTYLDARFTYRWFPYAAFTPYAFAGAGLITENKDAFNDFSQPYYLNSIFGLGLEHMIHDRLGLKLTAYNRYVFSDALDQEVQGRFNDFYWGGRVGISWYFGNAW